MSLELGVSDVNVKLINSAITSVRIDGFVVNNPIDFQGKQMVITVFNTFAPLTHVGALQTIASELDLELIATVAEPYAMARCAATDEVYDFGGIFIDIGGGTTDIALIRNGGIEGTRMFPIGGRVFTKKLASRFGISFADAEAVKLRHSKGELPPDHAEKVHAVLARDAEVLVEGVATHPAGNGEGRPPAHRHLPGGRRQRAAGGQGPAAMPSPGVRSSRSPGPRPSTCFARSTSGGFTIRRASSWISRTSLRWGWPSMRSSSSPKTRRPCIGLMRKVLKAMKV